MSWNYGMESDWVQRQLSSQGILLKTLISSLAQLRTVLPQILEICSHNIV